MPNRGRGNFTRAEDVFIYAAAADCKLGPWIVGEHCLISDAFELEPVDFDCYEPGVIPKLDRLLADTEGKVKAQLVHETSIMARVEGECYQGEALR